MKKIYSTFIIVLFSTFIYATTHTIQTIGNTFSPSNTVANVGDSIHFILGPSHNAVEVSQSTYDNFGTSSNGGFSIPFGSDTIIVINSPGILYYVCQPHVSSGMRGTIYVNVGCTDLNACNYDPQALVDDGSCIYLTGSTISVDSVSCNGGSNGSVQVSGSGGSGSYTFVWDNGQTGYVLSGLNAGTYVCTISDNNYSCSVTESVTIYEPQILDVTINDIDISCYGLSDGSASATVSGGTSPYTFVWSNNAPSSSTVNNLPLGFYTCTIIDANQCPAAVSNQIEITQPDSLTTSILSVDSVSCNGDANGGAQVFVSGGTNPYTFQWDNGQAGSVLSGVNAGTYVCTINDVNGCQKDQSVTIYEPSVLGSQIVSIDSVKCFGGTTGSAEVVGTGSTPAYTYQWSNGTGGPLLQGVSAGNYTCLIYDYNSCSTSIDATILQPNFLEGIPSQDSVSCNGGADGEAIVVPIGGTMPYTFQWNIGPTGSVLSGLSAGAYFCVITDANNCQSASVPVNVLEPDPIFDSVYKVNITCNGDDDGQIFIDVTGGTSPYNIVWSNGDTGSISNGLSPGDYYCFIVDANLCPTIYSDTLSITQPDLLVIDSIIQDSTSCYGYNDGLLIVYPSGGTIPYSFNWENNDVLNFSDSLFSGNYYVIVNDNNGCEVIDSQNVYQPIDITPPTLSTYYDTICFNSSTDTFSILNSASGGGGNSPYEYQWWFNNNTIGTVFIGNGLNHQLVNLTESTKVWVETYSSYGCGPISSDTIFIHVFDELQSGNLMINDSICYGTNLGQIIFENNPTGANNSYSYDWQSKPFGGSWNTAQNSSSTNNYIQDYNLYESMVYRVNVISNEGCGSILTPEFNLYVYENFIPGSISSNHEICLGDSSESLTLSSLSTGGNPNTVNNYIWEYYNGTDWDSISNTNNSSFEPGVILQDTKFRLKIINSCYSDSLYTNHVLVVVNPLPQSIDILGPTVVCQNSSDVQYSLSNYDSTLTDVHYTWFINPGGQNSFVGTNISYNCLVNWSDNSGTQKIIIRQRDAYTGCFNRDTLLVMINNSFSPDKCNITQSPNTEMLISDDISSGIHYQWGYYNITNPNDSFVVYTDTLQFIHYLQEHNHIIDESVYRYWVDTWYEESCKTRSYFNWNPVPLNIEDAESEIVLNIYPNPVSNKLFYEYESEGIDIDVIDVFGRKVNYKINNLEKSLIFNDIKNGIYFLIIKDGNKKITKKFIVKS
tara:strand:- start:2049 stop:5723 length:3675 start_codon:yes stop_codon:yes gene_type:complete